LVTDAMPEKRELSEAIPATNRLIALNALEQGALADRNGHPAEALAHCRAAVAADPGFATAHLSLGNALQAAGDVDAAAVSYGRATELAPEHAGAHFNLGITHLLRGKPLEAERSFRAALILNPDFPEALVGLADALETTSRDDQALAALDTAIDQRPDYAGALLNSALLLRKLGKFDLAAERLRGVVLLTPDDPAAHYHLGMTLHDAGRLADASSSYRRALSLQPGFIEARTNLALVLQLDGRKVEAIDLLFAVVAERPADPQLRRLLAESLDGIALSSAADYQRVILRELCADDNISMHWLNSALIGLIKSHVGYAAMRQWARESKNPLAVPEVQALMRDDLLLTALPRMTLIDVEVERVFTAIRRYTLLDFVSRSDGSALDSIPALEFVCALARQCFYSGYAFFAEADEMQAAQSLQASLATALAEPATRLPRLEHSLAIMALYNPLHALPGAERLECELEYNWCEAFGPLVREQLSNRREEREIARRMRVLTPIDDRVSVAVREQYEQNPYPRWVSAPHPGVEAIEALAARLRPGQPAPAWRRPVPMLVAGCGTGHHPIQLARKHPDADVLAVDLSLASLAYASRMTKQLGISNIAYVQGDILHLSTLDRRFEVVECCGVLHHLDDPVQGWKVLVGLMERDGLMRIALYSEHARGGIRAAREFSCSLRLPDSAEGIRRCRHAIMALEPGHPARDALGFEDFYTLDGCRDLVLHAREHQFTLPRIADCLEQLDLRFLGFECSESTRRGFQQMFPGSEVATDLAAWDRFEQAYPGTFKGMYTFWCCRTH